jgi:hypothetical protein
VTLKPFIMKTKIITIVLAAIIMIGETSCFVRVRARTPRARVRVRVYAPPANNAQQENALLPFNHSNDSIRVNN